jgi:hypothetical protein
MSSVSFGLNPAAFAVGDEVVDVFTNLHWLIGPTESNGVMRMQIANPPEWCRGQSQFQEWNALNNPRFVLVSPANTITAPTQMELFV